MMRRSSHQVAAVAVLVCLASFAAAQDIATFSDVQLIEETREAVGAQDAEAALDLLTEMQRRGTGIFAGVEKGSCDEVIDLPEHGIKGNSHMLMMDRNNQQIAQLIQDWLKRKGLAD